MPEWWSWTAVVLGLLLVAVLTPVVGLLLRRRWLASHGRVFACSLRRPRANGQSRWAWGMARIRGDALQWYRVFSLSVRPAATFTRGETRVVSVHRPAAADADDLYEGHLVAELGGRHAGVELAMGRSDLTAFSSWTEAAPPGASESPA